MSVATLSRTDERTMLRMRTHPNLPCSPQKQYVPGNQMAALSQKTSSVATTLTLGASTTQAGRATALPPVRKASVCR